MKLRIRKLISLIAFAILVFAAGACNQQNSPTDRQSSTGAVAAGSDQAALAEGGFVLVGRAFRCDSERMLRTG